MQSAEIKVEYKKQKNKCVKIRNKRIQRYMDQTSEKGFETNKRFWNFIKSLKMWNKYLL